MIPVLTVEELSVETNEGPDFQDVGFQLSLGEAAAATSIGPADLGALLEVLAGLKRADKGRVSWNRLPAISILDDASASAYRRYRILRGLRQSNSYVSPSVSLLNHLTIYENIALPLRYHFDPPERVVEERTLRLMDRLKLSEVAGYHPAGLPLGVVRRASVARALILEPTILFLNSPLSAIDNESSDILISALSHFRNKVGLTVLAASYEPRTLLSLVTRLFIFSNGKLNHVLQGEELHESVFFRRMSHLQGRRREDRNQTGEAIPEQPGPVQEDENRCVPR